MLSLPNQYIHPVIVLLCFSGAYLITQSHVRRGAHGRVRHLGYVMRKLDFSIVAFIIAFILGPLFEDALRQTLVLFGDTPGQLIERPIAILFVVLTAFSVWRLGFRQKPAILREP